MTKGVPRSQPPTQLTGQLWLRVSPSTWELHWARASSKRLSLFLDDREEDLVEVISLGRVQLTEVTFQDVLECGRRHSRGLRLRAAPASGGPGDELDAAAAAAAAASETESLLHSGVGSGGGRGQPAREVVLAAEDAAQHATWLKWVSRVCANRSKLGDEAGEGRPVRGYSTGIRSPPQAVLQRLCGPGLVRGRQLMERLRYARWQLEGGLRDLSSVRDEARGAQRPINDLHSILLDMSQALDIHHADVAAEADVAALRQCQDWLQNAITFVMEVDHHLDQLVYAEPGTNVAAEWVPLAHNTILQLRDIEDAMRAEELRQLVRERQAAQQAQQQRDAAAAAAAAAASSCRSALSAPAMPYSRWWAGKVAL